MMHQPPYMYFRVHVIAPTPHPYELLSWRCCTRSAGKLAYEEHESHLPAVRWLSATADGGILPLGELQAASPPHTHTHNVTSHHTTTLHEIAIAPGQERSWP